MRIGIFGGDSANGPISSIVDAARSAADAGFASFWLPQIFGVDALDRRLRWWAVTCRGSSSGRRSCPRSRATRWSWHNRR